MPFIYCILILMVAIIGCCEGVRAYREQKKGGKPQDMLLFISKIVLLMILMGLLVMITNWIFTIQWVEI